MAYRDVVKAREYRTDYYEKRKLTGLCVCCHKRIAIKGMVLCPDCRDNRAAYSAARYDHLKREGICLTCQSEPALPGRACCAACRDWNTQYARRIRDRRAAEGRCSRCGRKLPADYGYKACPDCLEKTRLYQRNRKEKKRRAETIDGMDNG